MLKSVLIANRGEIARRVIRTAKRLGVRTVAVYSDADAKALHVREADEAVHIGPSPAKESYLRGEKIIAAAKQTGAEAIHPGYGFLSENADFAQAVIDAGLIWIGPKPDSIRAMGLKDAAKKLMAEAGVPTTPGYLGEDQGEERLQKRGRQDRLSGADQGRRRRRRQGHAQGREGKATSKPRSPPPSAKRRRRSATIACCSRCTCSARATSRCRCSAIRTAMSCICSSAIARCSAATRR